MISFLIHSFAFETEAWITKNFYRQGLCMKPFSPGSLNKKYSWLFSSQPNQALIPATVSCNLTSLEYLLNHI